MSDLNAALKAKQEELQVELEGILLERNCAIKVARDRYAMDLKDVKAKQVRVRRMLKTAKNLLKGEVN